MNSNSALYYIGQDAARSAMVNDLFSETTFFEFIPLPYIASVAQSGNTIDRDAIVLVDLLEEPGQLVQLMEQLQRCFPQSRLIALHLYRNETEWAELRSIGFHSEVLFTGVGTLLEPMLKLVPNIQPGVTGV